MTDKDKIEELEEIEKIEKIAKELEEGITDEMLAELSDNLGDDEDDE
jgi:hypothetical protein